MWDTSLSELFRKGGIIMWPLLACSVAGVALMLERAVVILWVGGRFEPLVERLRPLLRARKFDEARAELARWGTPAARVAEAYLQHLGSTPALREEVVAREASQRIAALERRLHWLGLLAQATPLLGLLGTVLGLMSAFHQIDLKGAQVQSSDLAGGIWQKLLNTAFGLAIAIPCLMIYYWLENRVSGLALQTEWMVSYLNEWTAESTSDLAPAVSLNGGASRPPAPQPRA